MRNLIQPLEVLLPILFGISLAYYFYLFFTGKSVARKLACYILLIGVILHISLLVLKSEFQYFPVRNIPQF